MTPDELLESAQKLRDAWNNLIARHHVDVPAILAGAVALEAAAERLAAAEAEFAPLDAAKEAYALGETALVFRYTNAADRNAAIEAVTRRSQP